MFRKAAILIFVLAIASLAIWFFGFSSSYSLVLKQVAELLPKVVAEEEKNVPLPNPPEIIKAVYATGWSAGSEKKMNYLIDLIKTTELNALVIDIKDFSGFVLYDTELELPKKYKAVEKRIPKLDSLIKRLHDQGIYLIARVSVFQDPRLALSRPDLALQSLSGKKIWKDKMGLEWIDPAASESWDYNIEIAKEARERGFDEINFDYIRFPSDGNLGDIIYPYWDGKVSKPEVMKGFFQYLREKLPGAPISADIFGLTLVKNHDLEIGQYFENILPSFNFAAPMIYPSHYSKGFLGYKNPAQYPYEVIKYSMEEGLKRVATYDERQTASEISSDKSLVKLAKLRPWLQDFNLGAQYDKNMVRQQIQAVYDAGGCPEPKPESEPCSNLVSGWMLWNPENIYTQEALLPE